ncbi:hypothetical protein HOG47_07640 [archaeon]|jgi:hypothetical protein|nr:hypothetical protein [archaeon]
MNAAEYRKAIKTNQEQENNTQTKEQGAGSKAINEMKTKVIQKVVSWGIIGIGILSILIIIYFVLSDMNTTNKKEEIQTVNTENIDIYKQREEQRLRRQYHKLQEELLMLKTPKTELEAQKINIINSIKKEKETIKKLENIKNLKETEYMANNFDLQHLMNNNKLDIRFRDYTITPDGITELNKNGIIDFKNEYKNYSLVANLYIFRGGSLNIDNKVLIKYTKQNKLQVIHDYSEKYNKSYEKKYAQIELEIMNNQLWLNGVSILKIRTENVKNIKLSTKDTIIKVLRIRD